jgi:hypothetical protein
MDDSHSIGISLVDYASLFADLPEAFLKVVMERGESGTGLE